MKSPGEIEQGQSVPSNYSSILVSGGCNSNGAVPIDENVSLLRNLRNKNYKLNLHTGLMSPDGIKKVAPYADVVSFDFVWDNRVIREVYSLNRDRKDFASTYRELSKLTRVVPHLTIGILGGELSGEEEAVEKLIKLGADRIVFLVFIPTPDTAYHDKKPPSIEDVEEVFSFAREIAPAASFGLGCMHPRGKYKYQLEMAGYKYNFDSFVNPSRKFLLFLEENGVSTETRKECCVF